MEFLENIISYIQDHNISPGVSLALIILVGVHILEERLKGFRRFLNLEWFRTGKEDVPVSRLAEVLKDQVGLFMVLTALALLGMLNATFIFIAVGFVTADIIQHVVFSLVRRGNTRQALRRAYSTCYTSAISISPFSRGYHSGWHGF